MSRPRATRAKMELIEAIRERFRNGEYAISDHALIEARKDGIEPRTVEKLEAEGTWKAVRI